MSIVNWAETTAEWNSKTIDNTSKHGTVYFKLITTENGVFGVLVTNLIEVWEELLTDDEFEEKFGECNPNIECNADRKMKYIKDLFNNPSCSWEQMMVSDGNQSIELSGKIMSVPLRWTFKGECCSREKFFETVFRPYLLTVAEYERRQELLIDVIKRKDAEIDEYKHSGGKLLRRGLETKLFEHTQWVVEQKDSSDTMDLIEKFKSNKFSPLICSSGVRMVYGSVCSTPKKTRSADKRPAPSTSDRRGDSPSKPTDSKSPPKKVSKDKDELEKEELKRRLQLEKSLEVQAKKKQVQTKPKKKLRI